MLSKKLHNFLILQKIFDKLIKLLPFRISYSISFKDEIINNLLNGELKIIKYNEDKFVIVLIQGPIGDFNYLLQTIKIYQNIEFVFKIILSTWEGEVSVDQKKIILVNDKTIILTNNKPEFNGIANVNYQIVSTLNGLRYIKSHYNNCQVVKTRTDQRITLADFPIFLFQMFNCRKETTFLKRRIIICSFNTFKFRMYSISDMFMFGHIDDLLNFWDINLDENKIEIETIKQPRNMTSWSKLNLAEVYLTTNFLKNINHNIKWTIKDYWTVLQKYFIVLDSEMIGLEWFKYTFNTKYGTCNQYNLRERFYKFSDWITYDDEILNNINFDFLNKQIDFNENIKIQKN